LSVENCERSSLAFAQCKVNKSLSTCARKTTQNVFQSWRHGASAMRHNDPERELFKLMALYARRQQHSNQTTSTPITSTQMETTTSSFPPPTRFVRIGKRAPHTGVIAQEHHQTEPTSSTTSPDTASPSDSALDFDRAFELLVRHRCAH
jgi:hypothetical protein